MAAFSLLPPVTKIFFYIFRETLMSDPTKTGRVTKAFMQMKKFDIKRLIQA